MLVPLRESLLFILLLCGVAAAAVLGPQILLTPDECAVWQPAVLVQPAPPIPVYTIAGSAAGDRILCRRTDGIVIWDRKTGIELRKFRFTYGDVTAATLSPCGRCAFAGFQSGRILAFDSGPVVDAREEHDGASHIAPLHPQMVRPVSALACSPCGRLAAAASDAGEIAVWDLKTGGTLELGLYHEGGSRSLAFSQDGSRLISVGQAGSVLLWDVGNGFLLRSIEGLSRDCLDAAVTPGGEHIVAEGCAGPLRTYDVATGDLLWNVRAPALGITSVAVSPDGRLAATGQGKHIALWDLQQRRQVGVLKAHTLAVTSLQFLDGDRTLLSGSYDGTVRLWDLASRRQTQIFSLCEPPPLPMPRSVCSLAP